LRLLRCEPLEDRRLLATIIVTTDRDVVDVDGPITSIAALRDDPGDDGRVSLREAILAANVTTNDPTVPDEIKFDECMRGKTIRLELQPQLQNIRQLQIEDGVMIIAFPQPYNVTIDAGQQSRVINIDKPFQNDEFPVTLEGLTITRGQTTDGGESGAGGGIRSDSIGLLTLNNSTVSGNSTTGSRAYGGGIFSHGEVKLTQSTVSGNSTTGDSATGGGMHARRAVTLNQSTVSGNSTVWPNATGGGIHGGDKVTLTQSTVSGNCTAANGGGIYARYELMLTQSTVTKNLAMAKGGGVFQPDFQSKYHITITGSILADNTAGGGDADLRPRVSVSPDINYSLIGMGVERKIGDNNISTNDPLLAPLENYGGPTETHALLPRSPAFNAGDPAAQAGVAGDQRGPNFPRVRYDRIDIGAFESQDKPPAASGDYNLNGAVDAADYVVWRDTLGTAVIRFSGADGDGNGLIDPADYLVWRSHYGETWPVLARAAWPEPAPEHAGDAGGAAIGSLASISNAASITGNGADDGLLSSNVRFGRFALEPGSRDSAASTTPHIVKVTTRATANVDLLLILDSPFADRDDTPQGTASHDAAFSTEGDEVDLTDQLLAAAFASL
jgi:hypothetical protein